MRLILASNSPRRKEILSNAGFEFDIITSDYEEKNFTSDPIVTAETFALGKAKSVYSIIDDESAVVLGADTVVCLNGVILGKPKDENSARIMLEALSGKKHLVVTGFALVTAKKTVVSHVVTKVTFNKLSPEDINDYISSGLYKGKAGSYGIQDGYPLVEKYEGSLSNVIGLPIDEVKESLSYVFKIKPNSHNAL